MLDSGEFDLQTAVDRTIRILSRNPRGYFLMVEWDVHTDRIRRGLDRMVTLDRVIERTARTVGPDTLLLFTADHSFDLRLRGGTLGQPLLEGLEKAEAERAERARSASRRCAWTTATPARKCSPPRRARAPSACAATWRTPISSSVMMAAYGWETSGTSTAGGK